MPYPRLIPCLDVSNGRVVKGTRFEQLRDVGDPVEHARAYSDGGADELVFLDIDATIHSRTTMFRLAACVAEQVSIPFTVGGGLRGVDDAAACLDAGADRIAVNSAAVAEPALISALSERFGAQAVVVSIDARDGMVHTHAGSLTTPLPVVAWACEVEARGAGEILLTSIDADGTRDGYDLLMLRQVVDAVSIPVIASGGAGNARHVADALRIAPAALVASVVHDDPEALPELRDAVRACGMALRPLLHERVHA